MSNLIDPLYDIKEYSSFGSDIDLLADSPSGNDPARWVRVVDAGAGTKLLVIDTVKTAGRSLTVATGQEINVQIRKIKSTTTAVRVQVGW